MILSPLTEQKGYAYKLQLMSLSQINTFKDVAFPFKMLMKRVILFILSKNTSVAIRFNHGRDQFNF